VTEPLTAESLAYWHREVTDRHNGDSPWRDEDVMVLVARFLATLEAADRATPTPDTRLRECFTERTDCRHGVWESLTGDHFAEHLRAALTDD